MPRPLEDDDTLPGLPALDGDDEPVGGTEPDEDQPDDGDESVGLDAATGPAESEDPASEIDAGDDDERWLDAAEAAEDVAPAEDGLDGADEEGQTWTDIGEDEVDDPALDEDDLPDEPDLPVVPDRGEEGVEESEGLGGHDDESELPPFAAVGDAADEASDDLDLREEGEIEDVPEIEDDLAASAGRLPERLPADRVAVEHLGPAGDAVVAVACAGERVVAGGARLYAGVDGPLVLLDAVGLESHELTTVALDPHDVRRIAVGTRLGGALCSTDGGATFHEINGWRHREPGNVSVPFFVVAEPHSTGTRLWGRTRAGALYRSEDFGDTWVGPVLPPPVAAVARDPAGGVVAIHFGQREGEQLVRSDDGGRGWRMSEPIGLLRGEGVVHVAALGAVTAMARDGASAGVFYSTNGGATWSVARSVREPTAIALVDEGGPVALYAALFLEGEDKGVVVRQVLGGHAHVVLDLDRERADRTLVGPDDSEGEGRVNELVVTHAHGATTVLAATQVGVFRVVVRTGP